MAKEEPIEFEGLVTELLPGSTFLVKLENGAEVIAYASGKMRKHRIRILAGDRVTVEMSPYDLTKARVSFRHKDERAAPGPRPAPRVHPYDRPFHARSKNACRLPSVRLPTPGRTLSLHLQYFRSRLFH